MVARNRDEKLVEPLALVGVERREELVLDPLDDRTEPRELALPVRCQQDGVAPAVLRVALPLDQAALLETVQQPDELTAVEAERVGDRPLRPALALGDERETP